MNPFKSSEVDLVTNWNEEIIDVLLPKKESLITKKWTQDYRIQIDGYGSKVTQEGVERIIYGNIHIHSISKNVLVKINLLVGKDISQDHAETVTVGNFYFNGHINPNHDAMGYLPHLEFNLSIDKNIWEGVKETLQNIHEKSILSPEISIRVDYESKPDPKTFIEEGCSDSKNITYFWLESIKGIDSKMLKKNTVSISDFQK
jgi:hypothetical protein